MDIRVDSLRQRIRDEKEGKLRPSRLIDDCFRVVISDGAVDSTKVRCVLCKNEMKDSHQRKHLETEKHKNIVDAVNKASQKLA